MHSGNRNSDQLLSRVALGRETSWHSFCSAYSLEIAAIKGGDPCPKVRFPDAARHSCLQRSGLMN